MSHSDRAADQNIFDIQQGICVTIMVKKSKAADALADVYYSEVVGSREKKFDFLRTKCISEIEWHKLTPTAPSYFMSPRGMSEKSAHIEWINLAQLFPVSKVGVKTHHDNELISKNQFDTTGIHKNSKFAQGMANGDARFSNVCNF